MTSKNLFFKLIKEDFKRRLWAVALLSLGCFFLFPVSAAFLAGNIADESSYEIGLAIYTRELVYELSFGSMLTVFGMVLASLICGLSSFAYLNSRSKVDFYHSLPVRREKLFAANFLNGILFTALPYAVCLILSVLIGTANGADASRLWPAAISGYILNMIYYILMYATVVLASMMTGHLVVGFLGSLVFAFAVPLGSALVEGCFSTFFSTYVSSASYPVFHWGTRFSPLMEYVYEITADSAGESVLIPAVAALAVSALIAAAALALYLRRPSEAAGKAMAFAWSMPVIRIFLTILSGIGMALFFWAMRESMGWMIFGIVCGCVICHGVIEMIYHFDFRKLFAHKLQLLACIAASIAILCAFRYDLTGYDRWVPESSQIKEASIDVGVMETWTSYGTLSQNRYGSWRWDNQDSTDYIQENMHYHDADNIVSLMNAGVQWAGYRKQYGYDIMDDLSLQDALAMTIMQDTSDGPTAVFAAGKIGGNADAVVIRTDASAPDGTALPADAPDTQTDPDENAETQPHYWTSLTICCTMNNGRKVYRSYYVSLNSITEQLDRLMSDPEYLNGTYPVMARTAEETSVIRYREGDEEKTLTDLSAADKEAILAAYKREYAALTTQKLYEEAPIGLIRFTTDDEETAMSWMKQLDDRRNQNDNYMVLEDYEDTYRGYPYVYVGSYSDMKNRDYYPVYPSFTDTIALLEKQQVTPGSYFKNQQLTGIRVTRYSEEEGYRDGEWYNDSVEITITDPAELTELLDVLADQNRTYYNTLYLSDPLEVTLTTVQNGATVERSALFPKNKTPDFILKRLEELQ
jgi:ABC-2 type transport system permease protein